MFEDYTYTYTRYASTINDVPYVVVVVACLVLGDRYCSMLFVVDEEDIFRQKERASVISLIHTEKILLQHH